MKPTIPSPTVALISYFGRKIAIPTGGSGDCFDYAKAALTQDREVSGLLWNDIVRPIEAVTEIIIRSARVNLRSHTVQE